MKEIEGSRQIYGGGGGDGKAINRHSTREYISDSGRKYLLDRTLDASPPFFTLYEIGEDVGVFGTLLIPRTYQTDAFPPERHWGDGYTWKTAVAVSRSVIQRHEGKPTARGTARRER
jgi:hypothetical protein